MSENANDSVRVGVLMYTYDRVDDARINMEIIRRVWSNVPLLREVKIVHTFNGKQEWWPETYLEDELCRTENPGHFVGAELLMNAGIRIFEEKYPDITHVIVLASDTWCVKPEYIEGIVRPMALKRQFLATNAWGSKKDSDMFKIGMALDFFLIDMNFVRKSKFFPLRYTDFVEKHGELLMYQGTFAYLERVFALRFKQAITRTISVPSENLIEKVSYAHIYHMKEREPVHYDRKRLFRKPVGMRHMYWPALGLITHHEPHEKQRILKRYNLELGEHGQRFLDTREFSQFNRGKTKTTFEKNHKIIHYND